MKKLTLFAVLAAVLVLALPIFAYSGQMLSPGLEVLSYQETMVKSGLVSGEIRFTREDFTRAVGCEIQEITLTSLPSSSAGILYLGTTPVSLNQVISASALDKLCYVQTGDGDGSFRFKAGQGYSIACLLKYTDGVNRAPVASTEAEDIAVWTQADITTYGTLAGYDPDGDGMVFEIVEYPQRGLVELTSATDGSYRYTPYDGAVGEDSFVYVIRDQWGNYSEEVSVIVDIDEAASELVFADMDDHWAHNAALVMAAEGAMELNYRDGQVYFDPEAPMTREDFVVTVMKALGSGEIEPAKTVFDDNASISTAASGYIAHAYNLGIVKGSYTSDGKHVFNPDATITRAEAAVILNTILGANMPETVPTFADSDAVPAWAKGSLYALSNEGILGGTGGGNISPNSTLNRAQTAQILMNTLKIYKR